MKKAWIQGKRGNQASHHDVAEKIRAKRCHDSDKNECFKWPVVLESHMDKQKIDERTDDLSPVAQIETLKAIENFVKKSAGKANGKGSKKNPVSVGEGCLVRRGNVNVA